MNAAQRRMQQRARVAARVNGFMVEAVESFSYKLQVEAYGGPRYESRDFFQSAKRMVRESDFEAESERLYDFCRRVVERRVRQYVESQKANGWQLGELSAVKTSNQPAARANAAAFEAHQKTQGKTTDPRCVPSEPKAPTDLSLPVKPGNGAPWAEASKIPPSLPLRDTIPAAIREAKIDQGKF